MLLPSLSTIGFTDKETVLYDTLLNFGEQDAARLIKETGLKRPTVYKSLYSLVEKGIVEEIDKNNKAYFRPRSPEKLLKIAEDKYHELDRVRNDISTLLPEMVSAFTLSTQRPVVSTFQGVKGLKKIYQDMLNTGKEINAFIYTGEVEPELFKWLTGSFTRERVNKKIPVKSIVASGGWSNEYEKESKINYRETRLIDPKEYLIKHEISIFGEKISFIDFHKDSNLIGVVINHKELAQTMRSWFELTWGNL